jgi:hypothetical protein
MACEAVPAEVATVAEKHHLEVLALTPVGLGHKARKPQHNGFHLGRWVYPGESGTSFHGTSAASGVAILQDDGRVRQGPRGDPPGTYHSEQVRVAWESYAWNSELVPLELRGFLCQGVVLQLKVTNLLTFTEARDARTGLRMVPGPLTARWNTKGRPQAASNMEDLEVVHVFVFYKVVGPPPPPERPSTPGRLTEGSDAYWRRCLGVRVGPAPLLPPPAAQAQPAPWTARAREEELQRRAADNPGGGGRARGVMQEHMRG